ncbi:MAG: nitrate reductase subunit alpha [Deinococcales bacterium]
MKWIKEVASPTERKWEAFYRNRFQHDKRVRTTHGVNCTGSCSWEVFVKDGIVTWELQATDYPHLEQGLPPYEPRGCQRGISFSWYLYSPIRVKHPYARGVLIDAWRAARARFDDPVEAWRSLMDDPATRSAIQRARGKGGFRRVGWEEAQEIVAASTLSTAETYGPDRVIGFSPIPAMSQVSYSAGSRFLSLFGGVPLSFYDWYCDLPPASPEVWGEQTDVHESADWYNARFIAVMGSNLNMTRTPDTHFVSEVRHAGAQLAVLSPDFSQVAKYADWWIPAHAGQDGAFWMAVDHVLLKECYVERNVPFFTDYLRRYTDAPFLVRVEDGRPGRFLRAGALPAYRDVDNPEGKLLVWDETSGRPRMPQGTIGFRWGEGDAGKWNLEPVDGLDGEAIAPELSFADEHDERASVTFDDLCNGRPVERRVPVRYVETDEGRVAVATAFDLLLAQFNVAAAGEEPVDYDEEDALYTPAWQESRTGVHRDTLLRFARAWATNAEKTGGKNLIIVGAGANHWYHNNLIYRSAITALMLTGAVGTNGGGLAHYVGQEKLACHASWGAIAFGADWGAASRQQNAPSFHYVHTDQWRYEPGFGGYDRNGSNPGDVAPEHTIDHQARAVRMGWLPFYPQFDRSPLQVAREAAEAGATTDEQVVRHVVDRLRDGSLKLAVEDPDAPANWPRVWFIWRGNAIGTSMKGHEFMLRHYLGTHSNATAPERAEDAVHEVTYRDAPLTGKLDLVVDINFRMDTSALYSDIVLPAATWYEKDDLNSTDLHSFINPMQEAVPPAWESRSDWEVFKGVARKVSELARTRMPEPVLDVVMQPLKHDSPDELAQPRVEDWRAGEADPEPGRTMPHVQVVRRDYAHLYDQMLTLGPGVERNGLGVHGLKIDVADVYAELRAANPRTFGDPGGVRGVQRARPSGDGQPEPATYPSLESARDVADAILALDPVSNGELAHRAFAHEEHKTGVRLTDLAEGSRDVRVSFDDLVAQPRRVLTSPTWTGIVKAGRAYTPFALNRERLVPWRTLTGRQHFYLDHEQYLRFGEALPTYKPKPDAAMIGDTDGHGIPDGGKLLNYITPHGKWSIHSTYSENHRMMTLSRGDYPVWLNAKDAHEMGIRDNDWVELINNNGVFVQRCITSARIPRGAVFVYHATERTVGIPKSPTRGRRAGMNNSITRARLKPVLMSGGYAQFTYGFNYWGPTGGNRDTFVYVRRIEKPEF